jgi:hypothetical protein
MGGEQKTATRPALLRKARMTDALTFLAIILISAVSAIFAIPLGVAPQAWLHTWQTYIVVFIMLAMGIAVLGFTLSTRYKLEADRLGTKTA